MNRKQFFRTSIGLLAVGTIAKNLSIKSKKEQLEEKINEHLAVMQGYVEEGRIKQIRVPKRYSQSLCIQRRKASCQQC